MSKTKVLQTYIKKIVREEIKKNFRSMMLETIGELTIQKKDLSFLNENVETKTEKQVLIAGPSKKEIRSKLLEKMDLEPEMAGLYEDVDPLPASANGDPIELQDGDDSEGIDPSAWLGK